MNVTFGADIIGTHLYNPPEIYDRQVHVVESDVYSLALVIWELWYGKEVYSDLTDQEIRYSKTRL